MGTEVTEVVERKTPLYDTHVKYKGKIVPFAGYLLPVQYDTGVIGEHMAVRTRCGLFDVSHMGEIICRGKDALQNLNMLLTNDYTVMAEGQARYSPMCNEEGGVVDDLIVYKVRDNCYFIVVNAANKDKDYYRDGYAFNAYCASYLLCKKYGIETKGYFDFSNAPGYFRGMDNQEVRGELNNIRESASDISLRMSRILEQGRNPNQREHSR